MQQMAWTLSLPDHLGERDAELGRAHRARQRDQHRAAAVEVRAIGFGGVDERGGVEVPEVPIDELGNRTEPGRLSVGRRCLARFRCTRKAAHACVRCLGDRRSESAPRSQQSRPGRVLRLARAEPPSERLVASRKITTSLRPALYSAARPGRAAAFAIESTPCAECLPHVDCRGLACRQSSPRSPPRPVCGSDRGGRSRARARSRPASCGSTSSRSSFQDGRELKREASGSGTIITRKATSSPITTSPAGPARSLHARRSRKRFRRSSSAPTRCPISR